MAASSSSSATQEYDVFISFRGEDTRHNFTSHLYFALSRYSIKVYIDYELNKGDEISPALIQAIQNSHGSLVVLSENYASSKWCLNELLKILECRKQGHFVIPVFYNIDPSQVRKQTAGYGEAFARHEQDSNNKNILQKWKAALTEIANISGWDSQSRNNRDESELIQNIVKDVLKKLDHIYQPSQFGLIGIDKHCEHIESLLRRFPAIGIWGMGGIGKTTIAKAVFDKLSSQYDSCCFFENVREESQKNGLNHFRDKLLGELLNDDIIPVNSRKVIGFKYAMRRLTSKKVFIVLDDVNNSKQLEHLGQECSYLGPESKVIITTRDRHLLTCLRVQHVIYEVERLNFEESLELFKLNALNENYPKIGYEEITEKFVLYAKGIPLALKVLGSFLPSKSIEEWESAWKKLNKIPNEDIEKVLRLSFDGLNHEEQQIFLDIACFLKGWYKETIIGLLDNYGFYGAIGIRTLQDRALITISDCNMVQMHDLIQELGWEIVRKESIEEPGRRSRLWDSKEVYDVLKYNEGTNAVQGIYLNMSQIKDLHLNDDTFKKMVNLRFLHLYGKSGEVHLHGNIQSFSFSNKLRYLRWDEYPFPSLPSTFCVEKIVVLHMPNSSIKKLWNGVQNLVNLKNLSLRGSKQLTELPDFSRASSLEQVDLSECTNLCHIHSSILSLHTLQGLRLQYCEQLKSLQSEVHLKSLSTLNIHFCSSLKEFSLTSEELRGLSIAGTAIQILHSSIGRCNNLRNLTLHDSIKNLPSDLSKLTSLELHTVIDCRELDTKNLNMAIGSLRSLRNLRLVDFFNLSQLPDNIKYLCHLTSLEIRNCESLTCLSELPPCLEILYVTDCTSLETIIIPTPIELKQSRYFLTNCVNLDELSLSAVIEHVNFRIKQAALCEVGSSYHDSYVHDIFLPGYGVPSWFRYRTRQNWITIEIPPRSHLLGFAFCYILSPELLPNQGKYLFECGCNCYLEDGQFTKFPSNKFDDELDTELISDHLYIWYDQLDCYKLFDAMKEQRANGQSPKKLSFEFFVCADYEWFNKTENAIKECGVWPIYASEYDNSVNESELSLGFKLGYRTNDIDEEEQLSDPTSENFKPCLLPTELEFDKLRPSTIGTGVASSVFDHQDQDIALQNARQDFPEINSSCLLFGFSELDNAMIEECEVLPIYASEYESQIQVSLESGFGHKSNRCWDMDDNQQLGRKKFNRCQDTDDLLGGANTSGIGVGCSEFIYSAGSFDVSKMDNKIECGVWSIYAPEYESSIDETDLDYEMDYIDEEIQFFDPTTKDFNPSLLPTELLKSEFCTKSERCVEIDELEPKTIGNVVEGSAFDHQNKDEQQSLLQMKELMESAFQPLPTHISMQNDTKYMSEKFSCGSLIGLLWKCLWRLFSTQ